MRRCALYLSDKGYDVFVGVGYYGTALLFLKE